MGWLLFILVAGVAAAENFQLTLFNQSVDEGQTITYKVEVVNPSLSGVSLGQVFIGPDGGRIKLEEIKNVTGLSTFQWKTPFNREGTWRLRVNLTAIDFESKRIVDETQEVGFNVTKLVSTRWPKYIIFALSALTSLFTTLASYFMIDQKRAKAIREKVSAMQKELMAAQRSGDKKRIAKAKRKQSEMMSLQSEMMRNQFKPMIIYMLPLLAVFYYLQSQYNLIPVAELPFKLSFMQFFHKNNGISADQFGFIAWYFSSATWFGSIFRKVFGVV